MSDIKLLNGDSYELIKDIPDNSIDLVYIDIPYQINYSGGGCLDKNVSNNKIIMNQREDTLLKGIDYSILDHIRRIMKHIYIYIWCSKNQVYDLLKYFVEKYNCKYNILVWCKDNPVPFGAAQFLSDIEYCLVFFEPGIEIKQSGYENKRKWYISHINQSDKKLFKHPTIKPIEFVKQHIINSTNEGDVVLDFFMGSGTTGVACKELNRNFIGIELDKEYYDIAVKRINGITAEGQLSIFTDVDKMEQESLF